MKKLVEGESRLVLDPKVEGTTPASLAAVERILKLAFHCMAPSRQERPAMKGCAEVLWRIRKEYKQQQQQQQTSMVDFISFSSSNSTMTTTSGGGG